MTDARTTQFSLEQWGDGDPKARNTQISIEQWSSVTAAVPPSTPPRRSQHVRYFTIADPSPPAAILHGWNEDYDAGTSGDYFVDNVSGSDANAGTSVGSPKATINAAITAAVAAGGQKIIRVRDSGSKYREKVDIGAWDGSGVGTKNKLTGYGTEKPVISGADVVTGWTQCTAGDATLLGATLGVASSPVWKKTVARSSINALTDLMTMCVVENDAIVPIVNDTATITNPHVTRNSAYMHTTTSFTPAYPANLETVTKAGVIDDYTSTQLTNAWLAYHGGANQAFYTPIISASGATVTITPAHYVSTPGTCSFSLINILPAMTAGTFGYKDNGDSTVTVFLYPTNVANLTSGIEIVSRSSCIRATNANYVIVEGFEVCHMGGDGKLIEVGTTGTAAQQNHLEFRHIRMRENVAGPSIFTYSTSPWIEHFTVVDIYDRSNALWQGFQMQYVTTTRTGAKVMYGEMTRVEMSAIQAYGQVDAIVAYMKLTDCCLGAHANLFNSYQSCDNILWWGIDVVNCPAYATWQASSDISIGMCRFDHNDATGSNYCITTQMDGSTPPTVPTTFRLYNNTSRSNMVIGATNAVSTTYIVRNCITTDVDMRNAATTATLNSDYNVLLDGGLDISAGEVAMVNANDVSLASSAVFNGATMAIGAGSSLRSMTAANLEADLATWEALYGVDLHRDVNGTAFTTLDFFGAEA